MAGVSIVIVSFNAREHLERCLEAVAGGGHEVVVVDNASSDGSPALVRERFPSVRLVELEENVGFGAANNVGMEAASGDWFLLLNSDAWPVDDAIAKLAAFGEAHPGAGIVGPRLRNPDGSLQPSVRGHPTLWRIATEYLFLRRLAPRSRALNAFYGGGFDHASVCEVEVLKGAVLFVRREASEAVGGFDPAYFMYGEEMDLCYRVREAGWTVVFDPEAEFVHEEGRFPAATPVRLRALLRRLPVAELEREIAAQLALVRESGVEVSHVDSHRHLHKLAPFQAALRSVLPRFGIERVRTVQDVYLRRPALGATYWVGSFWRRPLRRSFRTTDHFYMPASTGDLGWTDDLLERVGELPGATLEVGVHPGPDGWRDDERRSAARLSARARELGHELVSWREI